MMPRPGPDLDGGYVSLQEAARHAEDVGLDSVWFPDLLAIGSPTLDGTVGLAAVAAVTERVRVGAGVFVPALRPLVWAAKQVASLQYVARGRLVVGVGSGGGEGLFAAAGVPLGERGRRTDTALRLLPDLLAGRPTRLPDEPGEPEIQLSPSVPVPPFWVGNAAPVAIRRAAQLGDGWFPSMVTPDQVAAGATRLAETETETDASRRPQPTIAVGVAGALGVGPGIPARDQVVSSIAARYGLPEDRAAQLPITGKPAEAAERLEAYRAAGARHVVFVVAGGDWRPQVDLLAEVRTLLT